MTPERLRTAIRVGVYALVLLAPLPFGSVQPGFVLAIELVAAAIGLASIALLAADADARASLPRIPLLLCGAVVALGIFQIVPVPFSVAEKFNPTAELVRPLIPYLGLEHPPAVSWSVAAAETTDALLRFIAYVWIGLGACLAFDTAASRKHFAIVLVASASFQAVYGAGEYLTGRQHIFGFAKKHYLDSATGTFINRNHFATFLAMALPFALALSIPAQASTRRATRWRERVLALGEPEALTRVLAVAAAALLWVGLLLSHSRAGLLAGLLGAVIVLAHHRRTTAARWAAALGAVLLVGLLSLEIARTPGERFLSLKRDLAHEGGRLAVWYDALGLIQDRPFLGSGLGTFQASFRGVQSRGITALYDHAHNEWVELGVEGGTGLLLVSGLLFTLLLAASRNASGMHLAVAAGIAAVAAHSFFDFSLRIPAAGLTTAALAGLSLTHLVRAPSSSATRIVEWTRDPVPEDERAVPPSWSRGLVLVTAGLAVVSALLASGVYARGAAVSGDGSIGPPSHMWLGPKGDQLARAGRDRTRQAVRSLTGPEKPTTPPQDYEEQMTEASETFQSAARANPSSGRIVHALAAIECELRQIRTGEFGEGCSRLLERAAELSPRDSGFQLDVVETQFAVAQFASAQTTLSAVVTASPDLAGRAVRIAWDAGLAPTEIAIILGARPEVLAALKHPFQSAGMDGEYLGLIEAHPDSHTTEVLEAYVEAGVRGRQPDRLKRTLSSETSGRHVAPMSVRSRLLARAHLLANDSGEAVLAALSARSADPGQFRNHETYGDALVAHGEFGAAIGPYQTALKLVARQESAENHRPRLYQKLANAQRLAGDSSGALDSLRLAIDLRPDDRSLLEDLARLSGRAVPRDSSP